MVRFKNMEMNTTFTPSFNVISTRVPQIKNHCNIPAGTQSVAVKVSLEQSYHIFNVDKFQQCYLKIPNPVFTQT